MSLAQKFSFDWNELKQALKKRYERFKRSILLVPRWRNFFKKCR